LWLLAKGRQLPLRRSRIRVAKQPADARRRRQLAVVAPAAGE
jgi:hypothetical protein